MHQRATRNKNVHYRAGSQERAALAPTARPAGAPSPHHRRPVALQFHPLLINLHLPHFILEPQFGFLGFDLQLPLANVRSLHRVVVRPLIFLDLDALTANGTRTPTATAINMCLLMPHLLLLRFQCSVFSVQDLRPRRRVPHRLIRSNGQTAPKAHLPLQVSSLIFATYTSLSEQAASIRAPSG